MPSCFFCPHCWKELDPKDPSCPNCGYDLNIYADLSYEDKLIRALHHPIRENRMMAAHVLGNLNSIKALPSFETIIQNENDFFLIREIAGALRKIHTAESRRVLNTIMVHPSRLVRSLLREG